MVVTVELARTLNFDIGGFSRFLDGDGRDFLFVAGSRLGGQDKPFRVSSGKFSYFDVVDLAVLVQVEIVDLFLRVVEESFKFFWTAGPGQEVADELQVEVFAGLFGLHNGDLVLVTAA